MNHSRRHLLKQSTTLALSALLPLSAHARAQTTLEHHINATIQTMRQQQRISADERTAWAVTDLNSNQKLVSINEHQPLQAASMVKPLIIQAYLFAHHYKDPTLYPLDNKITSEMREMIVHSNNDFTNRLIKRLGGPQGVQWILKKHAPQIFHNIQIVEYIPAQGRTYQNRASASDYERFLHALWHNQLAGANFLKTLMSIPNHDRIRANTQFVPKTAIIYDKTGSTSMLCGNTGIIEIQSPRGIVAYTLTAIIEKQHKTKSYSQWITQRSNIIREISDLVYLHFARTYALS